MIYLLKLIIFTVSTLVACAINDVISIKIERRIGIAKRPILLFARHLPGYLNFIPYIAILFIAVLFSSQKMSTSPEYIIFPLILIFITKLSFIKNSKQNIYFETICIAAILLCILPVLLQYRTPSWLSLVLALISAKIFNQNMSEPLPLNMARNLTINFYLLCVWFPFINFYQCTILAIVTMYVQSITYTLIPKFNQIKNSKLAFMWTFLLSLLIFILTSILDVFLSGVYY